MSGASAPRATDPVLGRPHAGRPLVMGVINVTPDSFSDGGQWSDPETAVAHGLDLLAQGADLLDVGGESTRPGSQRPSVQEELTRAVPVVAALAAQDARVSVDTMRAEVAQAALEAGAAMVNDVSGGLADPDMLACVAQARVPFVVMHWRGHSDDMYAHARYDDVAGEVCAELSERVEACLAAGVRESDLVLDPGFGFAKTAEHSWALLADLHRVVALGLPVLVGTSRKGFLGSVGRGDGPARPPRERDVATAATSLYAAQRGVWGVRVHDVRATVDVLDVAAAVEAASEAGPAARHAAPQAASRMSAVTPGTDDGPAAAQGRGRS